MSLDVCECNGALSPDFLGYERESACTCANVCARVVDQAWARRQWNGLVRGAVTPDRDENVKAVSV